MWSWLGLNLGKHAGVVSVVGLLVTLILGFGATRLDFATGQDSYLNKDEVVYKDNVKYQGLFGGEAMLTLYTMDDGKQVKDLFTPENLSRLRAQEKRLRATTGVLDVVSPITALQRRQGIDNRLNGISFQFSKGGDWVGIGFLEHNFDYSSPVPQRGSSATSST